MTKRLAGVDDRGVIEIGEVVLAVAMTETNEVDLGFGVGSRENQTHLTNDAMQNVLRSADHLLHEIVGVDRHRHDIAVLDELLGLQTLGGLVEETVSPNTISNGLQNGVTEDIRNAVVTVLPDERDAHSVHVLEGFGSDDPPVLALETSLGGVAAKVMAFHFDCSPSLLRS